MRIAITGGIGSGKSYVCRRLNARGIEVYDCDDAAKRLIRTSLEIRQQLTALIGPEVYTDVEGESVLNKAVVAKFLLTSESNAQAIDRIVHPAVFKDFIESGLQWMESALMFESGIYKLVDKVVAVVAPKEIRIRRVMERDHISREKVLEWMNRQMDQKEIIHRADYVIINDGETDIDQQLENIIRQCNRSF